MIASAATPPRPPWHSEHRLDAARVAAVLRAELPALELDAVQALGEGWDFTTYQAADGTGAAWVFRFPKRRGCARALLHEIALLDALTDALPGARDADIAVPDYRYRVTAPAAFPLAFGGYRLLPGDPLDRIDTSIANLEALGMQLGRWLQRVHAVAPGPPPRSFRDPFPAQLVEFREALRRVAPRLPDAVRKPAQRLLASAPPPFTGTPRLCHNDLGAEHMLVAPARDRIAAVIDWCDADWNDPLSDVVGLWIRGGDRPAQAAIDAYGLACSEADWQRLRFRGICCAVGQAHYGDAAGRPAELRAAIDVLERAQRAGQLEDCRAAEGRNDAGPRGTMRVAQ